MTYKDLKQIEMTFDESWSWTRTR